MLRVGAIVIVGLCLLMGCGQNDKKPALEVTYLANEGFMVSMGSTTILIDALPKSKYYANPSDTLTARLINGIPPFERVSYFLVTHDHPDHFNAELMSRFLLNHPAAKLMASSEACSKLDGGSISGSRLSGLDLELGEHQTIRGGRADITALRLSHGADAGISNLAYVVRSNGYTIVHVGDARLSDNEEFLRTLDWKSYDVDLLFIEYFDHSDETREIIKNVIKPNHVVLMHIPPGEEDAVRNADEKVHPRTVVFGTEGETKRFDKVADE
jgi:L-ascorbate metabolism protein UlaG (beta-lactamase superfamily)